MGKTIVLILLFVGSVSAGTPVDYKKWYNGKVGDRLSFSKQMGGAVRNFQRANKTWKQIENNFVAEGDSVLKADSAVLKSRVNKNGESSVTLRWGGQDYAVSQKLMGIGWLKISTKGRQWIDETMDFSNVSTDSNIVTWTGISPGVDYRVRKSNGSVAHGIFFKPAFLDSAVALYNQRSDSLDIALANVMVYTLSQNIDNADSGMGELNKRQLKQFGEYTFELTDQRLRYTGGDTLQAIPVKQFWRKRNDSIFCIEYVMMSDVKAVHTAQPNVVIWHNDTKTISGTTNVEDAWLDGTSFDKNYGADTDMLISGTFNFQSIIRALNIASELGGGATITDCSLYVYNTSGSNSTVCGVYRVFKPWEEGTQDNAACVNPGVSHNDWDCTTLEWTTAGCACANDDGVDNSDDDGDCDASTKRDRKSTAESTVDINAINTLFAWDISTALAQAWYDATANENGVLIRYVSGNTEIKRFTSTEGASNQAHWVFHFDVAAGDAKTIRKANLGKVKL